MRQSHKKGGDNPPSRFVVRLAGTRTGWRDREASNEDRQPETTKSHYGSGLSVSQKEGATSCRSGLGHDWLEFGLGVEGIGRCLGQHWICGPFRPCRYPHHPRRGDLVLCSRLMGRVIIIRDSPHIPDGRRNGLSGAAESRATSYWLGLGCGLFGAGPDWMPGASGSA